MVSSALINNTVTLERDLKIRLARLQAENAKETAFTPISVSVYTCFATEKDF